MAEQIFTSNNYERFIPAEFNREVKKTKKLEASMQEHGFISDFPIGVVRRPDGKLSIRRGHHRFYVARKLGIPIKYVESTDIMSNYQEGQSIRHWSPEDYLTAACRQGENPDYKVVQEYCKKSGISSNLAIAMFSGKTAGSGGSAANAAFKTGYFKIKDHKHPQAVLDLVLHCKLCGVEPCSTSLFVSALSKALLVKECNINQLKAKIKSYPDVITKQRNLDQYLTVLEKVYNRQSRDKLALKFLAYEEGRRRIKANKFGGENRKRGK